MHKAIGKHPVPLLPVPHLVGVEKPRVDVKRPGKAQDAYPCGNQNYDRRYHALRIYNISGLFHLQKLHSNKGTGLGIGEGMVVVRKVVPAGGRDSLELVVR